MSCDSYKTCPKCKDTLREWTEFGFGETENRFFISYRGLCWECGFEMEFNLSEEEVQEFLEKYSETN